MCIYRQKHESVRKFGSDGVHQHLAIVHFFAPVYSEVMILFFEMNECRLGFSFFQSCNCYNNYQVTATMSQHLLAVYIPPYLTCHMHIPTEVFSANILYYAATTKI